MIKFHTFLLIALSMTISVSASGKQAIVPNGSENTVNDYHYSPAVRAGDFIFASGVVAWLPIDDDGNIGPATPENMKIAFSDAFDTIAALLKEGGGSWDDVVEMTTYHTDVEAQAEVFMQVKDQYVKEPYPAWTAIDVDQLFRKHGLVEIKVIAYLPK